MSIELKYVALSPLHIQEMIGEKEPLLDDDGRYVFTDYKVGDEVPADMWGQRVINRMVEYRRILPVATNALATDDRSTVALTPRAEAPDRTPPPAPLVTSYADEEEGFPKHYGGPWYTLSDGNRVKGRAEAERIQALIDGG